jgi:hypothetical protein
MQGVIETSHHLVSAFADFCGGRGIDPEETLALLNAQDWKGAKEDLRANVRQPTVEEIDRFMRTID